MKRRKELADEDLKLQIWTIIQTSLDLLPVKNKSFFIKIFQNGIDEGLFEPIFEKITKEYERNNLAIHNLFDEVLVELMLQKNGSIVSRFKPTKMDYIYEFATGVMVAKYLDELDPNHELFPYRGMNVKIETSSKGENIGEYDVLNINA